MRSIALAVLMVAFAPFAAAQGKGIAGTYTLVSAVSLDTNTGQVKPLFGASPRGQLLLSPDGSYSMTILAAGLGKFIAGTRLNGQTKEYEAVGMNSLAHFGRYQAPPGGRTITFNIVASTFPNQDVTRHVAPYALAGDQLKYRMTNDAAGGTAEYTWRRQ